MAKKSPNNAPNPANLVHKAWQPALSVLAILLSTTSYFEAKRANDLLEVQFQAEQARQRDLDKREQKKSRSVVLTDISPDARELSFSIPAEDVRLRQVSILFPPELKADPVWTDAGRPQKLSIEEFEEPLQRLVLPADHGPIVTNDVLVFFPVLVEAQLGGRGEAYSEWSTYIVQIRSKLLNGKPRITFESFEMDTSIVGNFDRDQLNLLLSKCWNAFLPGMGRHDLNRDPEAGGTHCEIPN